MQQLPCEECSLLTLFASLQAGLVFTLRARLNLFFFCLFSLLFQDVPFGWDLQPPFVCTWFSGLCE